ncbi:hypothetical protein, partial [Pseudomonas fluorescens]|uniref:hypothetical protein n=1 Tax=Pseudomonas fluorescens TaxID=294 RepID=UPI001CD19B29
MQARIASCAGLISRRFIDGLSQWRPAKVLVLDVNELGRVVDGFQVELFDVALVFVLRLGTDDLCDLSGGAWGALQLWPHLHGLARSEQVLSGFLAPGGGEVMVQVFQNGP